MPTGSRLHTGRAEKRAPGRRNESAQNMTSGKHTTKQPSHKIGLDCHMVFKVLYSHLSVLINLLWLQRIQGGAEVLVVAAGTVQTGSQQQR